MKKSVVFTVIILASIPFCISAIGLNPEVKIIKIQKAVIVSSPYQGEVVINNHLRSGWKVATNTFISTSYVTNNVVAVVLEKEIPSDTTEEKLNRLYE